MSPHVRIAAVVVPLFVLHCSYDPIGELYTSVDSPYTEQVGPYLRITFNSGPDRYPSWSSDGSLIVYSSEGFERNTMLHTTVNIIPSGGGVSRRISLAFGRIDRNVYPCWLENDRKVAYISFRGIYFGYTLAPSLTIVDANDMSDLREITLDLNNPLDLDVSPDGSTLIYSDYPTVEWHHPDSTRVDGEEVENRGGESSSYALTRMWATPYPPTGETGRIIGADGVRRVSWCPASDCIAFSRGGYIYTIPSEGGTPAPLCEGDDPCWARDGRWIAYTQNGNIFVRDTAGGETIQVTTLGGTDPALSPDGERLAFSWARDARGENYDIYTVFLRDVTPRRLCRIQDSPPRGSQ